MVVFEAHIAYSSYMVEAFYKSSGDMCLIPRGSCDL